MQLAEYVHSLLTPSNVPASSGSVRFGVRDYLLAYIFRFGAQGVLHAALDVFHPAFDLQGR